MYVGTALPWTEFHQPDTTGITYPRLIGLGILVLIFRRIPALLLTYKTMPSVVKNWKEAVFMGYFGPIGVGAVYYLEHTRLLFSEKNKGEKPLVDALSPGTLSRMDTMSVFADRSCYSCVFSSSDLDRCSWPLHSGTKRHI